MLDLWRWANGWLDYVAFCALSVMNAPVCRPFWIVVMVACFAVGAWLLGWVVWRVVSYQLKLMAALKAEEERQAVAPPEVMAQYRWKGDDAIDPSSK